MKVVPGLAVALAVAAAPAAAGSHATSSSRCPRGALPLGRNAISPATSAALAREPRRSDPQVLSAALATADRGRGAQAKTECGARVWRRTVVVYIDLRAMPGASLRQRVDFVARFRTGYRVWEVAH